MPSRGLPALAIGLAGGRTASPFGAAPEALAAEVAEDAAPPALGEERPSHASPTRRLVRLRPTSR